MNCAMPCKTPQSGLAFRGKLSTRRDAALLDGLRPRAIGRVRSQGISGSAREPRYKDRLTWHFCTHSVSAIS
jgi:hypothetical protein